MGVRASKKKLHASGFSRWGRGWWVSTAVGGRRAPAGPACAKKWGIERVTRVPAAGAYTPIISGRLEGRGGRGRAAGAEGRPSRHTGRPVAWGPAPRRRVPPIAAIQPCSVGRSAGFFGMHSTDIEACSTLTCASIWARARDGTPGRVLGPSRAKNYVASAFFTGPYPHAQIGSARTRAHLRERQGCFVSCVR